MYNTQNTVPRYANPFVKLAVVAAFSVISMK